MATGTTKLIKSVTVSKPANNANYLSSGLSPHNCIVLSAYETANAVGANVTLGATNDSVFGYLFAANGTPYTSAATVTFYYI